MYYKILCLIEFTWLCSGINEIYMKNKNVDWNEKLVYLFWYFFFTRKTQFP